MKFFDHQPQLKHLQPQLIENLTKTIEHGEFIQGPEVRELEEILAKFTGVKHCISTSNGTDAILLALLAIGLQPGDEVITPAFSYISAAESVRLLGGIPVFAEVNDHTFNIEPSHLAKLITDKTKAIIPIDMFGQPANYQKIRHAIKGKNIKIIADCAQSLGATTNGASTCSLADISTTSFFPTKPLGCFGDGGAIFTDDDKLALELKRRSLHGQSKKYHHETLGTNARLDTLQAVILKLKMERFEEDISIRRQTAQTYDILVEKYLSDLGVSAPFIDKNNESVYAQYTIKIPNRDQIKQELEELGIPTAIHYPIPIYKQWKNRNYCLLANTEQLCQTVLSVPFYLGIRKETQEKVIKSISKILRKLIT